MWFKVTLKSSVMFNLLLVLVPTNSEFPFVPAQPIQARAKKQEREKKERGKEGRKVERPLVGRPFRRRTENQCWAVSLARSRNQGRPQKGPRRTGSLRGAVAEPPAPEHPTAFSRLFGPPPAPPARPARPEGRTLAAVIMSDAEDDHDINNGAEEVSGRRSEAPKPPRPAFRVLLFSCPKPGFFSGCFPVFFSASRWRPERLRTFGTFSSRFLCLVLTHRRAEDCFPV